MKYLSVFFLITIFSCSPFLNKEKYVELSILENKVLFTKPDSISFVKENERVRKFSDSCRDNKLNCYYDNETFPAAYRGGDNMFRTKFYDNLKIKKFTKPSNIKIKIIIGKQNNIRKVEISGFQNENIKNEIIRVLKLRELNRWHSANTLLGVSDSEISFFLKIK
ncbi:hypothetical protein QGN23_03305 [Chryseobacterium gotjawalense]|uniref:Lipoprotein n=1 Tax=Chryseobacterium gotjawalense TaxID=3042315 RepID=A0ABY8RGL4_9FLAO|nr:hypothetical protein [Chryseobacterium sp. wdc7]WHF52313.1 hypothetical protein QGN23_03305 [Chryseobacterium sp. wdc7]